MSTSLSSGINVNVLENVLRSGDTGEVDNGGEFNGDDGIDIGELCWEQ